MNKRIAFWGTPELCITYLEALKDKAVLPVVIITNPDRPQGRGYVMTPTPVKVWGEAHEIPVLTPEKLDGAFFEMLKTYDLDVSIVVAYGRIIPEQCIALPKNGTLNVHYSLLPKYRGASPTEAAILNGDTETGVSIQKMAYKLDSGDIVAEEKTPIGNDETTSELRARLSIMGAQLLVDTLPDYFNGITTPVPQDHTQATHVGKIKKTDAEINLNDEGKINYQKYRAYAEWPRAYFIEERDGKKIRIIITKARLDGEQFVIERVLPEGKKEISYEEWKRNY